MFNRDPLGSTLIGDAPLQRAPQRVAVKLKNVSLLSAQVSERFED